MSKNGCIFVPLQRLIFAKHTMVQELLIESKQSDLEFIQNLRNVYVAMVQKANANISQDLPHMIAFDNERLVDFIRLEAAKERRFFSIDFVKNTLIERPY